MSSPNNNVKSVKSLSCVIDVTLQHFNVLAAYVTLETGQISQNFLPIKGFVPLLRTTNFNVQVLLHSKDVWINSRASPKKRGYSIIKYCNDFQWGRCCHVSHYH
jgi:hypothetical protein